MASPSPALTLHGIIDLAEALDCTRIILAPVAERERGGTEQNALHGRKLSSWASPSSSCSSSVYGDGVGNKGKREPLPINIPLHGLHVEVVLGWLAAGWLVELESIALFKSGNGC